MLIEELETPSKILLSRFNKKYKLFKESPFFIRPQTKSKNKCKSPLKTTKETTEKLPKEVEVTEKVPKESTEKVPEETTEEVPEETTEKVPEETTEKVPKETTEKVTEEEPEETTEKVPEKVTEEVTEELEWCEHTIYKSPWYIKISKVDEDFIIELHNKKYYKESEITTIVNRLLDYSGVALTLGYYTTKHTDFFEWSIPFQIINITWPLLFGYIFGKYITLIYIFSKIF